MAIILSLIALLTAFLAGLGTVKLLSARAEFSRCEQMGAAALLGAGVVSLLSLCLGAFLHGAFLRWAVSAICIATPVFAWGVVEKKTRRGEAPFQRPRPRFGAFELGLTLLVVLQLCLVAWLSLFRYPLGWDGLFNWEVKARIAFANGGAVPLDYYTGNYPIFHITYPLFFPLLQLWIYEWIGHVDQGLVKLIGPYFYLAALLLVIGAARRLTGNRWSAVIAVLLFGAIPSLTIYNGAASGYADFLLGVTWLCALVYCVEYWRTGSMAAARMAGATAMLLPFIKSDGVIGFLCILIALLPKAARERNWTAAAWIAAPGAAFCLAWAAFLRLVHAPASTDLMAMTPSNFIAHAGRLPDLARWTWQILVKWKDWSLLWPLTLAAAIYQAIRFRMGRFYPWAANVVLPLFLYPAVFVFSGWVGQVDIHVRSALPRMLIHIAAPAVLLVSVSLGDLLGARVREIPKPAPAEAAPEPPVVTRENIEPQTKKSRSRKRKRVAGR